MRLVFLDFDGVLNCTESFARDRCPESLWEPALAALARLVRESSASIVISSSWRYFYPVEELTMALWAHGVDCPVLGTTPVWFGNHPRGDEVQAWLEENPRPETFVILDDNEDMGPLAERLVKTQWDVGLTEAHVDQALALLGCAKEAT